MTLLRSPYLALLDTVARFPANPFLHIPASSARHYDPLAVEALTFSYAHMADAIEVQRVRYARAGYGSGCRVALMLENRPAFFVHFFALNALGASIVPLNPDYLPHEIQFVVAHSEALLAVGTCNTCSKLAQALSGRTAVVDGDSAVLPRCSISLSTVEHAAQRADECAILYTSGTTGQPKGCVLDNEYFLSIGAMYADEGGLCAIRPGAERLITPLPLFHMNALACSTMAMVLTGGCVVQLDRFHPRSWWRDVVESGATIMHYLGVMPAILLGLDAVGDPGAAHAIRFGYGANIDPKHHHAFESRFGIPLVEGWAMTETGGAVVISSSHEPRHVGTRCFGRPRDSIAYRLLDEHGQDVADDMPGQLVVRRAGPAPRLGFFRAYLNDPVATEAAWKDGWFHTGDVVRRGTDGSLHFVDRQKNIIRRSGENIAALEVEGCLIEHPGVRQVAVVAAPDALRDEEVMAFVIAAEGCERDDALAQALQRWCLERLAYYKAPGYVSFVDSFPVTSTNKIKKTQLTAFGEDPLAAPLCFDLRANKKRAKAL